MKKLPFRYRVVLVVSLTIAFSGFIGFHFFHSYFVENIKQNYYQDFDALIGIIKKNYMFTLRQEGGKILYDLLTELKKDKHLKAAYVLDANGRIVFPEDSLTEASHFSLEELQKKHNPKGNYRNLETQSPIYRSIVPVFNQGQCQRCHGEKPGKLGYIILDFDVQSIEKNSDMILNFGRVFTLLLAILILIIMRLVHYKSIHHSLQKFISTISRISKGDLNQRVKLNEVEELGQLAENFNRMMERINKMQLELNTCHQRQLRNAEKMASVGELAASLAHEIKNPLMGITNALQVISKKISDPAYKEILEEILHQGERVNNAVNELLRFARPGEMHLQDENLNLIIENIINFFKEQTFQSDIEFIFEPDLELPIMTVDKKMMESLIHNLIQNAVQAIPKDRPGEIKINTQFVKEKRQVRLTIEDNGVGISEEQKNKIFKPFFSTKSEGTGLGLAICSQIVEQHQGNIEVQSEPGQYTRFVINIPVHQEKVLSLNWSQNGQN